MAMKPRGAGSRKEALDQLVSALGGYVAAVERVGGISKSVLHMHCDPDSKGCRLPLDVAHDLEAAAVAEGAAPAVSQWHLRALGFDVVPLRPMAGTSWTEDMGTAMREHGEAMAAMCQALADGTVTRDEAGRALVELAEAMNAAGALYGRLSAIVAEGQG